jgi:hypothetical protein
MSHVNDGLLNKPKQRVGSGKQPLVVRGTRQDAQPEILDKLTQLEASLASVKEDVKTVKPKRFEIRTIIALGTIALSITGYVIQDARNTSRLDAEIEMTKARVSNLERIATSNTEARIRTEVELKGLREGQEEIKRLLQQHDSRTRALTHGNQ